MSILLVRHAHAGDREAWTGDDLARPLSELGRRQSAGIAELLGSRSIDRVLSSHATRAIETVEPLAAHLGLPVEQDDRLWETTPADVTHRWMTELAATFEGDVVLCSHGDLIGPLLTAIGRRGTPLGDEVRWQKGSIWTLEVEGDLVTRARYVPPTA